jgi:HEAT repeat protein
MINLKKEREDKSLMQKQGQLNIRKNVAHHLAAALGIEAGEGWATILLFGQAFFLGVVIVSFYTAAYSLFLVEFGGAGIPYVYIAAAAVVTLAGLLFSQLEQRLSFPLLLGGTLAFLLISILTLRLGLWFWPARWLVFTLMVWVHLLWVITNLVLWALAGRLFNVRQGKRLFPIIMAGMVLGQIIIGFLVNPLIPLLGAANLMLVAVAGLVVSLLFLLVITRQFHDKLSNLQQKDKATSQGSRETTSEVSRQATSAQSQPLALFKSRYIFFLFIYIAFSTFSSYVLDFIFVSQAEIRYTNLDELAGFFGYYIGVSTFIVLLVSLGSAPIFDRYGLKVGLLSNSVIVAIGTAVVAIIGTFSGAADLIFWLVVLSKLFDDVLIVAMTNTSLRILYQPLPTSQQVSVQTAVESIVMPLSIGLVGLMLLLFGQLENFTTLHAVYLLLAILLTWIVTSSFLNREYGIALKQALIKRHLGRGSPITIDRSSINLLQQALTSQHVGVVIYALDMLEENEPKLLPSFLPDLLAHHAPEVRREVLHRIERLQLTSILPLIKEKRKDEDSWVVQGASLRTLGALGNAEQLQELYPYLENPQPEVRMGAMIGLLRSGNLAAILAVGKKLLELIDAPDPAQRCFAAQVLGEGEIPFAPAGHNIDALLNLLQDDVPEVQREALMAAGKINHPDLWAVVIQLLAEPKVRAEAMSSLVAGGQAVLNQIKLAIKREASRPLADGQEVLVRLIQICGRLGGAEAIALLEAHLDFPDEQIRAHILLYLNQCRYQVQNEDQKVTFIEQAIKADIAYMTWILAIQNDLGDQAPLLSMALTSHLASYRTRLFLWLSFLYEPELIQQLQNTLSVADSDKKAYVFEIMQTLLSTELSRLLIPLLNDEASALQRLKAHFPQQSLSSTQRYHELISTPTTRLDAWTRAGLLYTIGELANITVELTQAVLDALSAPEPLIRETAVWTIAKLSPVDGQRYIDHLRHDPIPAVSKAVRYVTQGIKQGDIVMLSIVEKVMALKRSAFFNETKENVLTEVAAMLKEVELKAGEVLFEKGEFGNCMYIIHEGQIRLHDEEKTFEEAAEGGTFGELVLLDPAPRSGQATALKDSILLRLDAEPFDELIGDHREVARAIMQILARRLRRW